MKTGKQWSVPGVGLAQWTMVAIGRCWGATCASASRTIYNLRKSVPARSNAEPAEQAAYIAHALQREVAPF